MSWYARCLRNVVSSNPRLITPVYTTRNKPLVNLNKKGLKGGLVGYTFSDMGSMPSESSTVPNQGDFLRQEPGNLSAD